MNIKKIVLVVVLGLGTVSNLWAMQNKISASSSGGEGRERVIERSQDHRKAISSLTETSEAIFRDKVELLHRLMQEYAGVGAPEIGKILATLTQQEKKFVERAKAFTEIRTAFVARHKAAAAEDLAKYKLAVKPKHN